jgi:hypothetical protein
MATPGQFSEIENYEKLISEVKSYLNRTDKETIDKIPLFINSAEKKIKRKLRMPSLESVVTLNTGIGGDTASVEGWFRLPFDYLEMKSLSYTGMVVDTPLGITSFNNLLQVNKNGIPDKFARAGDRIYIRPIPDADETFMMIYYKDLPETSETQTSVIYDIAHDVWLYLTLAEGFRFIYEPEKAQYWEDMGEARIEEIHTQVSDAEFSGGIMTMDGGWDE